MSTPQLYRQHELAFRTQYAELKERVLAAGELLPGTPGTLARRTGTGHSYWYRVYYPAPGKQAESLVCKEGDDKTLASIRERMEFAEWVARQVVALRKLGFQVADKPVARVLVELHNRHAFDAGLTLVGTLGYMAWLNEYGVMSVTARTHDIDLARHERLKLAAPLPFLDTLKATNLPFATVPSLEADDAPTSVKLPGAQALRVDVLAPGRPIGKTIPVPELDWAAQAVPYYDYLLEAPEPAAMLAGGHCVPVRLPQPARMVWHKLYSSTQRSGFPEKAAKDRGQALTLAAALADQEPGMLEAAFNDAPAAMTAKVKRLSKSLIGGASTHPLLSEALTSCLGK
ncbi:MAG: hypothetical protein KDI88_07330 [Gammaproteobacteria bacterium]|nr:hypothetical protein [Gammaproteobacteria bacterium]